MDKIEYGDKLYAQKVNPFDKEINTSFWVGKSYEPLQGSVMRYNEKTFRNHKHILNPRTQKITQEVFVVIQGSVCVNIFDENTKEPLGQLIAKQCEAIFVWLGYHEIKFLEKNTIVYEIKSGAFTTVSEDKEFFDI